jgi:hypothetical protein
MISWTLDDLGETANHRWALFELRDQLLEEFPMSKVAADLKDWCDRLQRLEKACPPFADVIKALELANDDTSSTQRRDALVRAVDDYTNRVTPFRDLMSWAPQMPDPSNFVVTEEMIEDKPDSQGLIQQLHHTRSINRDRLEDQSLILNMRAYEHPRLKEVCRKLAKGRITFREACINLNIPVPDVDTPEGEPR